MGQVTVTLNNRTYRLRCGDGEEERLLLLVEHVRTKLDELVAEFGQCGDDRLLLMTALLVTDELMDARARAERMAKPSRSARKAEAAAQSESETSDRAPTDPRPAGTGQPID